MIQLTNDPENPQKLILTQTVTLLLDRVMLETLNKGIEESISRQAARDLKRNPKVQKAIADAAQKKLIELLGVSDEGIRAGSGTAEGKPGRHSPHGI